MINPIISVHLPKTAGSSFRTALEQVFRKKLRKDYQGSGLNLSLLARHQRTLQQAQTIAEQGLADIQCIHGHFLPAKYLLLRDITPLTFVTWVREPIARLISHYYYWQRSYDPQTSAPHHKMVVEQEWTLEQFCLSPSFQNLYHQYLWAFPLHYFSFIGVTEFYEEDLRYFADHFLQQPLPHLAENTGALPREIPLSQKSLENIYAFHGADITLYKEAVYQRDYRPKHTKTQQNIEPLSRNMPT